MVNFSAYPWSTSVHLYTSMLSGGCTEFAQCQELIPGEHGLPEIRHRLCICYLYEHMLTRFRSINYRSSVVHLYVPVSIAAVHEVQAYMTVGVSRDVSQSPLSVEQVIDSYSVGGLLMLFQRFVDHPSPIRCRHCNRR